MREICGTLDIEILQGHVRPEHVHLLLSVPPHLAPSRVMQAIKGKTSHHLLQDHRRLRAAFWGRHLWARGYFVATSGNVTDDVIAQYSRAARCRARGRRPLSSQRDVSLHGAAMASSLVDFSRPRFSANDVRPVQRRVWSAALPPTQLHLAYTRARHAQARRARRRASTRPPSVIDRRLSVTGSGTCACAGVRKPRISPAGKPNGAAVWMLKYA